MSIINVNNKRLQNKDIRISEELGNGCINYDNQIAKNIYPMPTTLTLGGSWVMADGWILGGH